MKFKIAPRNKIGPKPWNEIVKNSPDSWVFGLYEWQTLICEVAEWGFNDLSFGCYLENELIAVVPLQIQPATKRAGSSAWGLCGPMLSDCVPEKDRRKFFLETIRETEISATMAGAEYLQLGAFPATESSLASKRGINPFFEAGYIDTSDVSKIIDLSLAEEKLWLDLSQSTRQAVKKANREGYKVEMRDWREMVDAYYEVHVETYLRTGVEPHPKKYFTGISNLSGPLGCSQLWVGFYGDEPVAFKNIALINGYAFYHTGCCRTEFLKSGINFFLGWSIIRHLKEMNNKWFVLGDIFPSASKGKEYGLTIYKSKFGGQLIRNFKADKSLIENKKEITEGRAIF